MNIRTERSISIALMLLCCIVLVWMVVLLRGERAENKKLREAFAVMVERSKWSCDLDEGERIICGVKDGGLSRLVLAQDDHVVSGKAMGAPLGKTKKKRRRG